MENININVSMLFGKYSRIDEIFDLYVKRQCNKTYSFYSKLCQVKKYDYKILGLNSNYEALVYKIIVLLNTFNDIEYIEIRYGKLDGATIGRFNISIFDDFLQAYNKQYNIN